MRSSSVSKGALRFWQLALLAGVFVSLLQVYAFLLVAWVYGIELPPPLEED